MTTMNKALLSTTFALVVTLTLVVACSHRPPTSSDIDASPVVDAGVEASASPVEPPAPAPTAVPTHHGKFGVAPSDLSPGTNGQSLITSGGVVTWGVPVLGGSAGGDLTGTYPNPSVVSLTGDGGGATALRSNLVPAADGTYTLGATGAAALDTYSYQYQIPPGSNVAGLSQVSPTSDTTAKSLTDSRRRAPTGPLCPMRSAAT